MSVHLRAPPEIDCLEVRGGVWGRSGVVYSPVTDKILHQEMENSINPHIIGAILLLQYTLTAPLKMEIHMILKHRWIIWI